MKTVYRVVLGDPIQKKIYGRDVYLDDPKDAIMDMFTLVKAAEEMYRSPIEWNENLNLAINSNRFQFLQGHLLCNKTENPFYIEIQTQKVPESFVCGEPIKTALTEKQEFMMENLSTFLQLIERGDIEII